MGLVLRRECRAGDSVGGNLQRLEMSVIREERERETGAEVEDVT